MKRQYFALKASLPMLQFDAAPPISSEEFLSRCEAFLASDRMKFLRELTLSPRERRIIRLRYGLDNGYCYTLEELGKIFHVTRERIRQIETKAMKKLQQPNRCQQLIGFLEKVS